MLRLRGGQVESLWDEVLPERLRELPDDLARLRSTLLLGATQRRPPGRPGG